MPTQSKQRKNIPVHNASNKLFTELIIHMFIYPLEYKSSLLMNEIILIFYKLSTQNKKSFYFLVSFLKPGGQSIFKQQRGSNVKASI